MESIFLGIAGTVIMALLSLIAYIFKYYHKKLDNQISILQDASNSYKNLAAELSTKLDFHAEKCNTNNNDVFRKLEIHSNILSKNYADIRVIKNELGIA